MTDEDSRRELVQLWSAVRQAFANYDLKRLAEYLPGSAGMPDPTREQARALSEFLPDLRKARFVKLVREGDRVGYYALISPSEVGVFRFDRVGDRWRIAPAPNSCSSYEVGGADEAEMLGKIEIEPTLRLFPPEQPAS